MQQLASHPGVSIFLQGVNISTTAHKYPFNVEVHYPKEHHGMPIEEGWFILTTLPSLTTAVQIYATRFQLEEMFRDYKSYGFHLELSQLNGSRFDAWFLLLTLVYSVLAFIGISTTKTHEKYLVRTTESKRQYPRRSIVTLGKAALVSGFDWAFISRLVAQFLCSNFQSIPLLLSPDPFNPTVTFVMRHFKLRPLVFNPVWETFSGVLVTPSAPTYFQ